MFQTIGNERVYLVLTDRILGKKELINSAYFEHITILVFPYTLFLLFLQKYILNYMLWRLGNMKKTTDEHLSWYTA